VTAVDVLHDSGIPDAEIKNHFAVFDAKYAPTVVIKKNVFTLDEALRWENTCKALPRDLPTASYLPFSTAGNSHSTANKFLAGVSGSYDQVNAFVSQSRIDISPCGDDRPYFYNMVTGVPNEYRWLLLGTIAVNVLIIWLPSRMMQRKSGDDLLRKIVRPLMIVACTGIGFMLLEVSLFQKLVLYLGSPTISLSILLCSMLVGMGLGSYFGRNLFGANVWMRLMVVSLAVVGVGIVLFAISPVLLDEGLTSTLPVRAAVSSLIILPLGFFLGIPFPSCIQVLALGHNERYIPWMYGLNGAMSVLGSVLAVVLSMLFGFTPAYITGLCFYTMIFAISYLALNRTKRASGRV
jgi:hypothetical protein